MNRKNCFAITVFIVTCFGIALLIALRPNLFVVDAHAPEWFTINMQRSAEFAMMCIQFFLIIAIITWMPLKILLKYSVPLVLVNFIPYFSEINKHIIVSLLLTVIVALLIKPKVVVIISIIFNIFIIVLMQYVIIFVKARIVTYVNPFFDATTLLHMNIDQFVLLAGLYYINRKVGEKLELVFIRKKNKS